MTSGPGLLAFFDFWNIFALHSIASVNISYQPRASLILLAVLLLEKCVLEKERKKLSVFNELEGCGRQTM